MTTMITTHGRTPVIAERSRYEGVAYLSAGGAFLTAEEARKVRDELTEILGDAPAPAPLGRFEERVVTSSRDSDDSVLVARSCVGGMSAFLQVSGSSDIASAWLTVDETREVIAALSATLEPIPAPTFAIGDRVTDVDNEPAVVIATRESARATGDAVYGDYHLVALPGNRVTVGTKYWQDAIDLTPA